MSRDVTKKAHFRAKEAGEAEEVEEAEEKKLYIHFCYK
jgi:hypothetical protein